MKEKTLKAAREKGSVTHKGMSIRLTVDLLAETLQARRKWGPIISILKRTFNPDFIYSQSELHKRRKNKILCKQASTQRFCHHQACFMRAPERGTTYRKEQPVPAILKTYQMLKSINKMKNLHQPMEKTAS